jgi:DNA-binding transcriptional ArsR family regulator
MVEQGMQELDRVFHALADGTRRGLLATIAQRRLSVGELAAPYAISRAALIRRERQGRSRMVMLNARPLEAAQEWMAYYERFWSERVDRMQATLEAAVAEKETKE